VTVAVPEVDAATKLTVATPDGLVVADDPESVPRLVMKYTIEFGMGFPSRSTIASIWEICVEPAANIMGDALSVMVPSVSLTVVDPVKPNQVAVTIAGPSTFPGERVVIACPCRFVIVEIGLTLPKVVSNSTGELETAFPPSLTVAVTVDVMVELAAIVVGFAVSVTDPVVMVTIVDLVKFSYVAVMFADPVIDPGCRIVVATPFESVIAVVDCKVPRVVEKTI
jgi:hypothetical protein